MRPLLPLAAVLALCAAPRLHAQRAPASPLPGVTIDLPFPSGLTAPAHRIELVLVGAGDAVPLSVRVLETPSWLAWDANDTRAGSDGVAALPFRVSAGAPVGLATVVRLGVMTADGAVVAERAYHVTVAHPTQTTLEAVAPNPFAGQAEVRFVLAEASRVRLSVYDALGREVARLAAGESLEAGLHTAPMDGAGLAAGVYVVRLVAHEADGRTRVLRRPVVRAR